MKKGFTLIELLAVIIILAIIALIATPVVLKVVDSAKESGRKSSIAGYADAVKLSVNEKIFETKGSSPVIDKTFLDNLDYQGERVTCDEVKNTNNYGVILKTCKVEKSDNIYCFAKGKVYSCEDEEFINIYNNINENNGTPAETVFNNEKGVNTPQLTEGMTPIKWVDGVETVTTASDTNWYDYNNKMWANAKTEDGSYWVWIPRYAYKITSGWHSNTTGTIDVIFLKNDTIENNDNIEIQTSGYDVDGINTSNAYFLEPAFQNETGNTKYGFWVAKFEMSNTADFPKSLPNVTQLGNIKIGDMFTASQNMTSNTNYGWIKEKTDTHMMTNYEWGAVAYLTQSSYGKNSEVWLNNSGLLKTGCSGNGVSSSQSSECQYTYETNIGVNASTTGNITGIYDMSGGLPEYTAAYVDNGNSSLTLYGNDILNSTINKNVYSITTDSQSNNYDANKNMYGDALYEVSSTYTDFNSWNEDSSYMPNSAKTWFNRGGGVWSGKSAGIFNFEAEDGKKFALYSFRVVVTLTNK